jgi:hypothetical protein
LKKEIIVRSGINGFVMLDSILDVNISRIVATRSFSNTPVYLGLESLAQLGAYHVRHLTGFTRHVFLIKINHCCLPPKKLLEGEYVLSGDLISQSDASFCYRLEAEKEGKPLMEGEFIFSSIDYDHKFKKDTLHHHYAGVFSCLQKDLKTG